MVVLFVTFIVLVVGGFAAFLVSMFAGDHEKQDNFVENVRNSIRSSQGRASRTPSRDPSCVSGGNMPPPQASLVGERVDIEMGEPEYDNRGQNSGTWPEQQFARESR